jgi:sugar lactone lactonase YvrE
MDENVSTAFTQSTYFVPEPVNLLVSSELSDSVKRYDPETGAYLSEFVSAGVDGQVEPGALTFGPDGNVYVAGGGNGNRNVKRFDGRTGAFIDTVTSGYPGRINDVTFGPDGYLYGSVFEADYVFRVDATTGTPLPNLGAGSPLDGATGLTFGADGNLYVADGTPARSCALTAPRSVHRLFATVPLVARQRVSSDRTEISTSRSTLQPCQCLSSDILRFDGTTAPRRSFIAPGAPARWSRSLRLRTRWRSLRQQPRDRSGAALRQNDRRLPRQRRDRRRPGWRPVWSRILQQRSISWWRVCQRSVIRYDGATGARRELRAPPERAREPLNGVRPGWEPLRRQRNLAEHEQRAPLRRPERGLHRCLLLRSPGPLTQITFDDGNLYVSAGPPISSCAATARQESGKSSPDPAPEFRRRPDLRTRRQSLRRQLARQPGPALRRDDRAYRDEFATVPIAGSDGNVGGVFGPDGDLYVP